MPSTYERKHRARMTKEVASTLIKTGMTSGQADSWVAHKMGMSPWTASRWRSGEVMPTGERWSAYEAIHGQLVKDGKVPSDVKVDKPVATPRATHPKKNGRVKPSRQKKTILVDQTRERPTMHGASVQLVSVIVNTMTLTDLAELHQLTTELILEKARR